MEFISREYEFYSRWSCFSSKPIKIGLSHIYIFIWSIIIIIAITNNIVTKSYQEKSKCAVLLLLITSCRNIRNNKNIALISKFTTFKYSV